MKTRLGYPPRRIDLLTTLPGRVCITGFLVLLLISGCLPLQTPDTLPTETAEATQRLKTPTLAPGMTDTPQLTAPQTPTATATMTAAPTPTPTAALPVITSLDDLPSGTYFIFWRANKWYLQNLQAQTPLGQYLPIESTHPWLAFSPDHMKVAFSDPDSRLVVYDLQTGELTVFPRYDGVFWIRNTQWSPDGDTIYYNGCPASDYADWECTGIYAASLPKRNTTPLLEGRRGPFSDGVTSLKLVKDTSWMLIEGGIGGEYFVSDLYLMDLACMTSGDCQNRLLPVGRYQLVGYLPGSEVLVICPASTKGIICMLDLANLDKIPQPVIFSSTFQDTTFDALYGVSCSPDGKYMIVSGNKEAGISSLVFFLVERATGRLQAEFTPDRFMKDALVLQYGMWSLDSKYLVVGVANQMGEEDQDYIIHYLTDIVLAPVDGSSAINLTNTPDEEEVFVDWIVVK